MRAHAAKRGFNLEGTSRPFIYQDFEAFDMIIALDNEVYHTLKSMDKKKKYGYKLFKMTDFYSKKDYDEVPDPYYLDSEGFELVLDILEDSCRGLLNKLKEDDS